MSKLSPLFVLPVIALASTGAHAADMVEPVMAPDVVAPVNYMSVEGGPTWNAGDFDPSSDKYGNMDDEDGFYFAATYRRMFRAEWDWQISAAGTLLDTSTSVEDGFRRFESDLKFQTIDFDFGYHLEANPLNRFFFGVRALHLDDQMSLVENGFQFGYYDSKGWAFGPRAGVQTETMLGASQFGLVAEGAGSILFGAFDSNNIDEDIRSDDNRTVYNLEGLAGLSWHATQHFTVTAGYRVQKWWNLRDGAAMTDGFYSVSADEDPLIHGPFLRAATAF